MRHGRRLVHAAALLLTLAACSMKNVEAEAPDAGETRTFDAPYAAVRRAAVIGIERMRLDITNQSEEPGRLVILFVRPTGGVQWGAAGRLVVDKSDAPPIAVHIVYDRRFPLSGGGQERWARAIFAKMAQELRAEPDKP
ncbi:MAG TPA: hypothetical protein VJ747_07600 [Stellaceae bacterium]|nr:hypothetical protein [Stellaceae bacterium]